MKTPIVDFIEQYEKSGAMRLHMPGHKGVSRLGAEARDITEISDADVLYHADGIIKESEENAARLFGSKKTLYSTEGCTLAIRAMLTLAMLDAKEKGKKACILTSRANHKSFFTSCALLDLTPSILEPKQRNFISARILPEDLEEYLSTCEEKPTALYLTSPDYLGKLHDLSALSEICKREGMLLLVDNAHGSYLHFLSEPCHPLDLGADLVCDSAHKTLPVLTGGAYLHLASSFSDKLLERAESVMALYASTSPSYLILQSLDLANRYLADGYSRKLTEFAAELFNVKKKLRKMGFVLIEEEALKITIETKHSGYLGTELAEILEKSGAIPEFADPDFLVLMLTPENTKEDLDRLEEIFASIPQKDAILEFPPKPPKNQALLSPREALFSLSEEISVENALGRCLGDIGITCPPAVPIALCGEILTEEHIKAFQYYRVKTVHVTKKEGL